MLIKTRVWTKNSGDHTERSERYRKVETQNRTLKDMHRLCDIYSLSDYFIKNGGTS